MVGDLFRRLVARCLAQTLEEPIATACRLHQFALSTGAGAEAVAHSITGAVEANPTLTVLPINGVGAYGSTYRHSTRAALAEVPGTNWCSPFMSMFFSQSFNLCLA